MATKRWMLATAIVVATLAGAAMAVEEPAFKQVMREGNFELRDYPALMVVETTMTRSGQDDGSFSRLFRFITGRNEAKQKISMTTPVFMSGSDSNRTMAFVMPAKLTQVQVPRPADGSVTVRELPAGRFALLRFSGGRNAKKESETLGRLESWMGTEGLRVVSPPIYGYFDPPWTPAFLRRNEVMLRTEPGK